MSDKVLFPTVEMPEILAADKTEETKYRKSLYWDLGKGDFTKDGANRLLESSGRDTYIQWCMKMAATERFACLAYPDELGTEIDGALSQPTASAVESDVERTITEALLVNPRTEYVRDFSFSWNSDSVYCTFTVKGKDWEEISLNTTIGIKGVEQLWQ